MDESLWQGAKDHLPLLAALAGGGAALYAALAIARRLRRARPSEPPPPSPLDAVELAAGGPPPTGPRLEVYHVPMRLAAVVLAPQGRGREDDPLPAAEVLDATVPGLAQVYEAHLPLVRRWPAQLSTEGFLRTFFAQVRLPGDRGKGTPWSALAGRCQFRGQNVLVGLVLCAAANNNLGQIAVDREHAWLDVARARA